MELDVTFLANAIGDSITAERFREVSEARKKAINAIFWNAEMQQWLDYWLNDSTSLKVISCRLTLLEIGLLFLILVWASGGLYLESFKPESEIICVQLRSPVDPAI